MGICEFAGMGYHVDDMQMTWTDKSQMMTSRRSPQVDHTNQSHKRIAQNNHIKQDDVTSQNGNDKRCFQMLQSNSGVYGGPETG